MGQTTQTAWNAGLQTGTAALRAAHFAAPPHRAPARNAGLQTGTAALRAAHVLTPTVLKTPAAPSATKTPYH